MAQIKLTKNELRDQQHKLGQLERYLPTLQLKKALLQSEVNTCDLQLEELEKVAADRPDYLARSQKLLTHADISDLYDSIHIETVDTSIENIAGVEVPIFQGVTYKPPTYSLFSTPLWLDSMVKATQDLITTLEEIKTLEEKRRLLAKELRDVSIRVNLFEKILIPRTLGNIKKIKIFLGDQQLSAVAQAKVAKTKIEARKHKAAAYA